MCRILLGLIIDVRLPGGVPVTQLICAVCALLDLLVKIDPRANESGGVVG